jgi:subtilisin family serine protease
MKFLPTIHLGILRAGKWAIITSLFLLLIGQTPLPLLAQAPQPGNTLEATLAAQTTARVIVALRVPSTSGEIAIQQTQDNLLQQVSPDEFRLLHQYESLPGLVGEVTTTGLETLRSQPEVAAVALDLPVQTAFTASAAFIKVDAVFNQFGLTGQGINVAVLDTGVDVAHLDLANRIVAQHCFSRNGCLPAGLLESDNAQDEQGHGTHVAGIIAGQGLTSPRGLASGVGLVAVRVLGSNGSGFTSDVLAGVDWVVANQATLSVNIINLSLGGGSYQSTCDQTDANPLLYAMAAVRARRSPLSVW